MQTSKRISHVLKNAQLRSVLRAALKDLTILPTVTPRYEAGLGAHKKAGPPYSLVEQKDDTTEVLGVWPSSDEAYEHKIDEIAHRVSQVYCD
jgi:hypothetical protein